MTEKDVREVGQTADSGDPVFEVSVGDGYANVICSDGVLYVPAVHCSGETRMKEVIDHAVHTFGLTTVKFTSVVSPSLADKLDGFEKVEEYHEGIGEHVPCLVGEWDSDRR